MGLMRQAMALIAKYRMVQKDGTYKTNLGWDLIGAHPDNRGGLPLILKPGCSMAAKRTVDAPIIGGGLVKRAKTQNWWQF